MRLRIIYLYHNNKPCRRYISDFVAIVSFKKRAKPFLKCYTYCYRYAMPNAIKCYFQERGIKEGNLKKGIKKYNIVWVDDDVYSKH